MVEDTQTPIVQCVMLSQIQEWGVIVDTIRSAPQFMIDLPTMCQYLMVDH